MSHPFKMYVLPSFLIILFIVAWYVDSSSQKLLDETNPVSLAEQEEDNEPAIAAAEEQPSLPHQPQNFELEEKLVHREEVDGYTVETYREYEIYKDQKGRVTKSVPTSNYDYIRYMNPRN